MQQSGGSLGNKMQVLPQRTQDDGLIFLLDDNVAICENGKILYYDDLGNLHDTNFECIIEPITKESDTETIKSNIIDLKNIIVDFCSVDLVHNKINNVEKFEFVNADVVKFGKYFIDLETLEIAGEAKEFKGLLPNLKEVLELETQEKIKAIVNAIYRKNIHNFITFESLKDEILRIFND